MQLKLNSWYVRLWNYTYPETVPNNLCPLFWKLVIAILLFPINIVLRIPVNIMNLFTKNKVERGDARSGIGFGIYAIIIGTAFILTCLYNYILWAINAYSYDNGCASLGGLFLVVGAFFIIRHYWLMYNTGYKIEHTVSNNIVVNYTKSWYENHCPKINWK